jgi:cation transport ATPase
MRMKSKKPRWRTRAQAAGETRRPVLSRHVGHRKMLQNLAWATGYNVFAIPLAAGIAYTVGVLLDPAEGAALMALSTIIVAINTRFLKVRK